MLTCLAGELHKILGAKHVSMLTYSLLINTHKKRTAEVDGKMSVV